MNRPAGAQAHPDRELSLAGRGDELKRSYLQVRRTAQHSTAGYNATQTRADLTLRPLQFSRFFEKMTDDLGSRMSALNSIWCPATPPGQWCHSADRLPALTGACTLVGQTGG